MYNLRKLSTFLLLISAAAILFSAGSASCAEKPKQSEDILLDTYLRSMVRLETSSFGLPLFLESFERDGRIHVDAYGIFDHPFSSIVNVLKVPANWCDIVPLHPNVKACTYSEQPGAGLLIFYIGKKGYQPPADTHQVIYKYKVENQQQRYMDIILKADAGPFGTENHRMRFEALPLDAGRTFVHVSYEYSDTVSLRFAEKAYFATLGRSKTGFTETGKDENGKPLHIGGPRGAIERNVVRYYFAIQTFMNTLSNPEQSLFSERISQWYDLTARYKKQLFEMDKKEYIASKTKEHINQLTLQRLIEAALK